MKLLWRTKLKTKRTRIIAFISMLALALTIGAISVFANTTGTVGSSSSFNKFAPIHYYSFDNDNGTAVVDNVNGMQDGAVIGNVTSISAENNIGNAKRFSGNGYIQFNDKIIPKGKKSIYFRIKKEIGSNAYIDANNGQYFLGTYYDYLHQYGIDGLITRDGKLRLYPSQKGVIVGVETSKSICDGKWHDILFTWDGNDKSDARLYVDDMTIPVFTSTATAAENYTTSYNLCLGSLAQGKTNYKFVGDLDEFKVYDKVIAMPAPIAQKAEKASDTDGVKVSWNPVSGANGYKIFRSTTQGTGYEILNSGSVIDATSFTDTTAEAGKIYYYVVTATNEDGAESVYSNEVSLIPTPTSLTAKGGDTKVDLTWNGLVDATGYNIKRSTTAGGPYTTIRTIYVNSTVGASSIVNYTDNNENCDDNDKPIENGTTYYYVVTAITPLGESGYSNEASATPQAAPVPPVGKNALVRITMVTNEIKEYEMSSSEVQAFVTWCNSKGANSSTYTINKTYNKGPFTSRNDYIVYDKIANFEVMEY